MSSPLDPTTRPGPPRHVVRWILLLVPLLGILACAGRRPDLERLYQPYSRGVEKTPVIVIPGVMGSRLFHGETGEEVWPAGFFGLIFGRHFDSLALPVERSDEAANRDALEARGIFHETFGRDFYANLLGTLEGPGSYDCAPPEEADSATDCFLFSWDWRRDFTEAAGELGDLIDWIRRSRGDPDLRVDVVAHSAGALITRYFIRYGGRDVLGTDEPVLDQAGAPKVRRAVLIAAPNYGSIRALQTAITGRHIGPFAEIRPEVLATMPGLYQLFPHPDRDWMIDNHGARIERDVYEVATWRDYRWSIFDSEIRTRIRGNFDSPDEAEAYLASVEAHMERALVRARRFHRALSIPLGSSETEFAVFGGDCTLTPARCLLEEVDGEVRVRLHPDDVENRVPGVDYEELMLEPGDGSVTKASLLSRASLDASADAEGFFPLRFVVFICEEHGRLPGNVTFRDNLLNILLY